MRLFQRYRLGSCSLFRVRLRAYVPTYAFTQTNSDAPLALSLQLLAVMSGCWKCHDHNASQNGQTELETKLERTNVGEAKWQGDVVAKLALEIAIPLKKSEDIAKSVPSSNLLFPPP